MWKGTTNGFYRNKKYNIKYEFFLSYKHHKLNFKMKVWLLTGGRVFQKYRGEQISSIFLA